MAQESRDLLNANGLRTSPVGEDGQKSHGQCPWVVIAPLMACRCPRLAWRRGGDEARRQGERRSPVSRLSEVELESGVPLLLQGSYRVGVPVQTAKRRDTQEASQQLMVKSSESFSS